MSKKTYQKHLEKDFKRVGKVLVDPDNHLAVLVAQAGAKAMDEASGYKRRFMDKFGVVKSPEDRNKLAAAEERRARKAAKRLQNKNAR